MSHDLHEEDAEVADNCEAAAPPAREIPEAEVALGTANLNSRQQKILRFLAQNEFIDTPKCQEIFETSEVTASRDLSALLRLSLIDRIGKGRATKYALRSFSNQGVTA